MFPATECATEMACVVVCKARRDIGDTMIRMAKQATGLLIAYALNQSTVGAAAFLQSPLKRAHREVQPAGRPLDRGIARRQQGFNHVLQVNYQRFFTSRQYSLHRPGSEQIKPGTLIVTRLLRMAPTLRH